jgi:hypothetical protein
LAGKGPLAPLDPGWVVELQLRLDTIAASGCRPDWLAEAQSAAFEALEQLNEATELAAKEAQTA